MVGGWRVEGDGWWVEGGGARRVTGRSYPAPVVHHDY